MKPPLGFSSWLEVQPFLKKRAAPKFSLLADYVAQSYQAGGAAQTFAQTHTLTRSTPRYVWDDSGQLVPIPANAPCYEYDPLTHEAKGLFLNPAAVTNYVTNSASLNKGNNTYYTYSSAPSIFDGEAAQKATATGVGAPPVYSSSVQTVPAGQKIIAQAIVEDSGEPHRAVLLIYGGGIKNSVIIDTLSGQIMAGTGAVTLLSSSGPSGGKVWLAETEYTPATSEDLYAAIYIATSSTIGGWVLLTHYFGLYYPQNASPTHPVVTGAAAGAVAPDVCDLATLPQNYGTVGCFSITYSDPQIGTAIREMLGDGTNAFFQLSADNLSVSATDGTNTASTAVTATGTNKVAVAWDATTIKICANNGAVITTAHNGNLGAFATPPRIARGVAAWYSSLKYKPSTETGGVIITDAELQGLTS